MSLRSSRVEQAASLPSGETVVVSVGVRRDPYVSPRESETVDVELRAGDEVLGAVNTVLRPDQESEARALAREIADGLTSGRLEPTAGAIEPLASRVPDTPYGKPS